MHGSNKSNGKETDKKHLCAAVCQKAGRKPQMVSA